MLLLLQNKTNGAPLVDGFLVPHSYTADFAASSLSRCRFEMAIKNGRRLLTPGPDLGTSCPGGAVEGS